MKIFSFGGGVQSTAALVLSAQDRIDYKTFLFSNVGDDSENPDTLKYIQEVSRPYALEHGLDLIEIQRQQRSQETLLERTQREDRSINIPVRMKNGAPGNRNCTQSFKIAVIRRWLGKGLHTVGLGISWDESQRMRDSGHKRFANDYPLISLRLRRSDCLQIVKDAGLPQPPKSSCWFCPYHSNATWARMRQRQPELFSKAVALEQTIIDKRIALGKDAVFLSGTGRPLDVAIGNQMEFDLDDTCESGYCMV